jgi:ParB family chromosome partitioning protein
MPTKTEAASTAEQFSAGGGAPHIAKPKLRALGRGLESLLPSGPRASAPSAAPASAAPVATSATATGTSAAAPSVTAAAPSAASVAPAVEAAPSQILSVALIDLNPRQTRRRMDPEAFEDIKRSIENDGILLPITVRPVAGGRYQISSGQRRFTAAVELGRETIHAIVKTQTDEAAFVTTIVENMQREDLSPLDQAYAFGRLRDEFGYSAEQIARQIGKDRTTVTNCLALINLPEELQQAMDDRTLTNGHAKALLGLKDKALMLTVGRKLIAEGASVRRAEKVVSEILHPPPPPVERPAPPVDPNVRDAEVQLQRALGLKVTVEDRNGRGRVIIEYASLDDFEVLMNSFGQRK